MTSSAPEDNDFDFDASVSSFNSDSEKVDTTLIKRILSEMKSEFNKGAGEKSEDENENENSCEDVTVNNTNIKEETSQNSEMDFCGENSMDSKTLSQNESLFSQVAMVINKVDSDAEEVPEQKPRLILTLRTKEEDRAVVSKAKKIRTKESNTDNFSESDVSVSDNRDVDNKGSFWESRCRRSLRSSSKVTDRENDTANAKRSSRRFSKEQCRESVLQNAIARKEKSFSSLNQSEERTTRRGARSPRQSPGDSRTNKPMTRSKSPKALLFESPAANDSSSDVVVKNIGLCETSTLLAMKTETDLKLTVKVENDDIDSSDNSNDTENINSASTNSQTSEPSCDTKTTKTNKMYTKTGKRRTKYFKGLKYSLTTGGSVRKKALNVTKRGKKKPEDSEKFQDNMSFKMECKSELSDTAFTEDHSFNMDTEMKSEDGINDMGDGNEDHPTEDGKSTFHLAVSELSNGCSPAADACPSTGVKRKYQQENEESDMETLCRGEVPSPSQGDTKAEPDQPEATNVCIVARTSGLCLCNSRTAMYAKTSSCRPELYCQAVDSLDGRLIGCCNTVSAEEARMLRPSPTVPFLVLCDVHYDRLMRHNCCPGCGIFCTQGQFVQCWAYHQFHRDCQLIEDSKEMCPHCGSTDTYDVNISLGAHKYPVLLPFQKPAKKTPSARMTFTCRSENLEEESEKEKERVPSPPLIPPASLMLPSGLEISSQGLPTLDKDKLEELLHAACSLDVDSLPRYTLRNMYQAAKSGEAEKVMLMLAAGLNPNHLFREWGMSSALHTASQGGHLTVVHLLVQAGASTDVLDRDQNTPLMLAAANGHNQVVKYLVKAGASVTLRGGDGMTALHLAAKSGNVEACHYLISNPKTPHSFIDSVDDGRWTPLVWAAEHKHYNVVKFLLEKRADPFVRDSEQNIALHWAALSGSIDTAEALLNYGSDVNSTNAHADTPLHIAARQNAYECVVLLLMRGARVDMHNRAGFLPLDCVQGAPNDTYTAIKVNVELRKQSLNVQKRAPKIITNDITRGHEGNPVQCVNAFDNEPEPQDFVYITENCFTSNISVNKTITSLQSCKCRDMCVSGGCMCGKISYRCWYDDEGKLLPEFNFDDPPLLFECNQACACNRLTCKNRVVQHGITARFQLFRTKGNKGWGLRTLRLIPKGAYVCEYIGEIITDCEADTREDDTYLFDLDNRDGETYCIDARKYGNIARFINHSCSPNLRIVRVFIDHQDLHFPRIAFFAYRDIQAYEELGFDYGEKFWIVKSKLFKCTCNAETCKYSETTIEKTLAAYNEKVRLEESH